MIAVNSRLLKVALLAEGVDRNVGIIAASICPIWVALLAEGVDRNMERRVLPEWRVPSPSSRRAWIEMLTTRSSSVTIMSPSSRRAWIEIDPIGFFDDLRTVALLAEGVDRNKISTALVMTAGMSPSSRRAWIEILHYRACTHRR